MKFKLILISLLLGTLLGVPTLISYLVKSEDVNSDYIVRGNYNPDLLKINSIHSLDSLLNLSQIKDTSVLLAFADSILKFKFYHGTCRYNYNEDWISFVLGKYIWDDFRMIVLPDLIMRKKMVLCNQMCIVFQTWLEIKEFKYRSVGLNNHMVTEVFYNDSWHAFDQDYEPEFMEHNSMTEIVRNHEYFKQLYSSTHGADFNNHFDQLLNTTELVYYEPNHKLAGNLRVFQSLSHFSSHYGYLIFFMIATLLKLL